MLRIYVIGRVMVEGPDGMLEASGLPGRQGRLALVYLAAQPRGVDRHELAEVLWPDELPDAWDAGLSAVISKLRKALGRVGAGDVLTGTHGAYEMRLPEGTFVDLRTAITELDRAEGAIDRESPDEAWSHATVASGIFRRRFLPGETGPWIDRMRRDLRDYEIRTFDVLARVWLAKGNPKAALPLARHVVDLAPYRESGYARLMECHLAGGDNAEAVRVYGELSALLVETMGISPSPVVEELYLKALG
ncbi:MAG: bacterial transcriptional activator domain-containing protein [Acidimicrobiia bacterium]|nr:bacterial transcriptional activator domain-containing protein [Acidimicrobiia bacterium]